MEPMEGGYKFNPYSAKIDNTLRNIHALKQDLMANTRALKDAKADLKAVDNLKVGTDAYKAKQKAIIQDKIDSIEVNINGDGQLGSDIGIKAKILNEQKELAEARQAKIDDQKTMSFIEDVAGVFFPKQTKGRMPESVALTPYEKFVYRVDALPAARSAQYESQIKHILDKTYGVDSVLDAGETVGIKQFGAITMKTTDGGDTWRLTGTTAHGVSGGIDGYTETQIKYTVAQETLQNLKFHPSGRARLRLSKTEQKKKEDAEKKVALLKSKWAKIVGAETLMREEGATVMMEPIKYGGGVMYHLMSPTLAQQDNLVPLTKGAYGEFVEDYGGGRINRAYSYDGVSTAEEVMVPFRGTAVDVVSKTPEGGLYKAESALDVVTRKMAEHTDPYSASMYNEVFAAKPIPKENWVGDIYLIEENVGKSWYKPPQMYAMLWKNDPPKNLVSKSKQLKLKEDGSQFQEFLDKGLITQPIGAGTGGQAYFVGIPMDMKKMSAAHAVNDYSVIWLKGMDDNISLAHTNEFLATHLDEIVLRQAKPAKFGGKYGEDPSRINLYAAQQVYKYFVDNMGTRKWSEIKAEMNKMATDPNYIGFEGLPAYGKFGYKEVESIPWGKGQFTHDIPEQGEGGIWSKLLIDEFEDDIDKQILLKERQLRGYDDKDVGEGIWLSKHELLSGKEHNWYMKLNDPDPDIRKVAEARFGITGDEIRDILRSKSGSKKAEFFIPMHHKKVSPFINQERHTAMSASQYNRDNNIKVGGKFDITSKREGDPIAGTGDPNPKYVELVADIARLKEEKDAFKVYIARERYLRDSLAGALQAPDGIMAGRLTGLHFTDDELAAQIYKWKPEALEKGQMPNLYEEQSILLTPVHVGAINKYLKRVKNTQSDLSAHITTFQKNDSIWISQGKQGKPMPNQFDESGRPIVPDATADLQYTGLAEMNAKVQRFIDMGERYYALDPTKTGYGQRGLHQDYVAIIDDYMRDVTQWKQFMGKGKYGERRVWDPKTKRFTGDADLTDRAVISSIKTERHVMRVEEGSDEAVAMQDVYEQFMRDKKYNEGLWDTEAIKIKKLTSERDAGIISQDQFRTAKYAAIRITEVSSRDLWAGFNQNLMKRNYRTQKATYQTSIDKHTPPRAIGGTGSSNLEKIRVDMKSKQSVWDSWKERSDRIAEIRRILNKPRAGRTEDENKLLSKWLEREYESERVGSLKVALHGSQLPTMEQFRKVAGKNYLHNRVGKEPVLHQAKNDKGEWYMEGYGGNVGYKEFEVNGQMMYQYEKTVFVGTHLTEPPATILDWKHSGKQDITAWSASKFEQFQQFKTHYALQGGRTDSKIVTQRTKEENMRQEERLFQEIDVAAKNFAEQQERLAIMDGDQGLVQLAKALAEDGGMPSSPIMIYELSKRLKNPTIAQTRRLDEFKREIKKYEAEVGKTEADYSLANHATQAARKNMKNRMIMVNHKGKDYWLEPQEFEGSYKSFINSKGQEEYVVNSVTGKFVYDVKMTSQPQRNRVIDMEEFTPDGLQPNPNKGKPKNNPDGTPMFEEDLVAPHTMQKVRNIDYDDYQKAAKAFEAAEIAEKGAKAKKTNAEAMLALNESNLRNLQGKLKAQGIESPRDMMTKLKDILEDVNLNPAERRVKYFDTLDLYRMHIFGTLKRNFDETGKFRNAIYSDVYEAVPILRGTDPFGFLGYVGAKGTKEEGRFILGGEKSGTAFNIVDNEGVAKAVADYGGWEKLADLILSNQHKGYGFKGMFQSSGDEASWRSMFEMWQEQTFATGGKIRFNEKLQKITQDEIADLRDELVTLQAAVDAGGATKQVKAKLLTTKLNITQKTEFIGELKTKRKMYDVSQKWMEKEMDKFAGYGSKPAGLGDVTKVMIQTDKVRQAETHLENAIRKYDMHKAERMEYEIKQLEDPTKETVIKGQQDETAGKFGGMEKDFSQGISPFTSGLGDSTFVGQLVKVSAPEFQGKLDMYLDWMHGVADLPEEIFELGSKEALERGVPAGIKGKLTHNLKRLVGAENLPQTSAGRVYRTNVMDIGSGYVPFIQNTETKPFFIRVLERMTRQPIEMEQLLTPYGKTKTLAQAKEELTTHQQRVAQKEFQKPYDDLTPSEKEQIMFDGGKGQQLLAIRDGLQARVDLFGEEAVGGIPKIQFARPADIMTEAGSGKWKGLVPERFQGATLAGGMKDTPEIMDAMQRLYHTKVRTGFMGNLYDKIGGYMTYPWGSKWVKDWTGRRYRYKRKEAFDDKEAGIHNITPQHVWQVEQELGFHLAPHAPRIRQLLHEGQTIKGSEKWSQKAIDNWIDQITDKSGRDLVVEAAMRNIPLRLKMIQKVVELKDRMSYSVNKVWTPEVYRGAANVLDEIDDLERSMAVNQKRMYNAEVKLAESRSVITKHLPKEEQNRVYDVTMAYRRETRRVDAINKGRRKREAWGKSYEEELPRREIVDEFNNVTAEYYHKQHATKGLTAAEILGKDKWDSLSMRDKVKVSSYFDDVVDTQDEIAGLKLGQKDLQKKLNEKRGTWLDADGKPTDAESGVEFQVGEFQVFRHGRPSHWDDYFIKNRVEQLSNMSAETRARLFPNQAQNKKLWQERTEEIRRIRREDYNQEQVLEQPQPQQAQAKATNEQADMLIEHAKEKARLAQRAYMQEYANRYGFKGTDWGWHYQTYVFPPSFAGTQMHQQMEKMKLGLQADDQGLIPKVEAYQDGAGATPPAGGSTIPTGTQELPDVAPTLDTKISTILDEISIQMQKPVIKGAYDTRQLNDLFSSQAIRPVVDTAIKQDTVQRLTPILSPVLKTPLITKNIIEHTPLMRTWFPPALMGTPFGLQPSMRRRPRQEPPIRGSMRKIWWDVPSQPLGEPWAAQEYKVFGKAGVEGEPKSVKEKEYEKDLDSHPFGMGWEDDLKFWSVPDYQRSGFGMGRRGRSKDSKSYAKSVGGKMPHQKRIKFKFPDSDI